MSTPIEQYYLIPVSIKEYLINQEFHSQLYRKLKQIARERNREERKLLIRLEDQYFGDYQDKWIEGNNYPGFQSIATVLETSF
jgi:hypothetical protein